MRENIMKQKQAINALLEVLRQDVNVEAIFLKGSIAQGLDDIHSDVDMYCIINEANLDDFLQKRIKYLETYRPVLYWSESNFVGPQIVAVYDDGLHFDLYTLTQRTLSNVDEIKVLYDPQNILKDYKAQSLSLTPQELIDLVHEFTFILLEFEVAFLRNDLLWASRLASHLFGNLSLILRHVIQPNRAQLGIKKLYSHLPFSTYSKLLEAMDNCGPSSLPHGVVTLLECFEEVIEKLPYEIRKEINMNFVQFMSAKIRNISLEVVNPV